MTDPAITTRGPHALQPPTGASIQWEQPAPRHTALFAFAPPARLTPAPALWLAATGPAGWTGAGVVLAEDDDHYEPVGQLMRGTLGHLADPLCAAAVDGWSGLAGLTVELAERGMLDYFSLAACLRGQSLCCVGTATAYELVAYTAAVLEGLVGRAHQYRLSGWLRRGLYGTPIRDWPAGTSFLRCDAAVLRLPIEPRLCGWPLYLKLGAINAYGEGPDSAQEGEPFCLTVPRRGGM